MVYEEKIQINKAELLLMMTEYWALDNNENCRAGTKIFLERNNLNDIFEGWVDIGDYENPSKSDIEFYDQGLKERRESLSSN